MRRVVLLMAVWCYSWSAWASEWQTSLLETPRFENAAWVAWDGGEMLGGLAWDFTSRSGPKVSLEYSSRKLERGNRFTGYEERLVFTISDDEVEQAEKISLVLKHAWFGAVYIFDSTGKEIGRGGTGVENHNLRFTYEDKEVLLDRSSPWVNERDGTDNTLIILSIARRGQRFQWLGHTVEMVTLSAKLLPAKESN